MVGLAHIALRNYESADLDAVAVIWFNSASLPGVGPREIPPISELRVRLDRELDEGWTLRVAVCENELIGFVAIKREQSLLDQLFLRPDMIGLGLGRFLFEEAKRLMPAGFNLHTASSNSRGRQFYEKLGMALVRESEHPLFGHPIVWYGWYPQ